MFTQDPLAQPKSACQLHLFKLVHNCKGGKCDDIPLILAWELPGKLCCLRILQAQSNFLRKCSRREGSHGTKQTLCPKPGCREWHRTPWKFLSAAKKAMYHAEAQGNDAAHGSCVTVFIAKHFPYSAITSQTQTTLPWPKACGAFCQPK